MIHYSVKFSFKLSRAMLHCNMTQYTRMLLLPHNISSGCCAYLLTRGTQQSHIAHNNLTTHIKAGRKRRRTDRLIGLFKKIQKRLPTMF
jgi:hypothetical protein